MTAATTRAGETTRTLAQADLLLLVAELLAPPGREAPGVLADALELGPELFDRAGLPEARELSEGVERLRSAWSPGSAGALRDEYHRLFDGAVACPIGETAYVRRDKGHILADIAGFYRAFGLELDDRAGEKGDHLAAELEFVAMVLVMVAMAESDGDAERAEIAAGALASFAYDHLGEWLPSFCERLARTTRLPWFVELAGLVAAVWGGVCQVRKLPLPHSRWEPLEDEGTPYECGMAELGLG